MNMVSRAKRCVSSNRAWGGKEEGGYGAKVRVSSNAEHPRLGVNAEKQKKVTRQTQRVSSARPSDLDTLQTLLPLFQVVRTSDKMSSLGIRARLHSTYSHGRLRRVFPCGSDPSCAGGRGDPRAMSYVARFPGVTRCWSSAAAFQWVGWPRVRLLELGGGW
jgi:hypothetical protein